MRIFNTLFFAILCALPSISYATENCPFFSPAMALCSVHTYNVGDASNPTDSVRASEIDEVIGLKSTFMVQQLKEQYDALNAVIKRFKTQLEKAVLTSKIEVLTGNTASSSGGSSNGGSNSNNGVSVAGASDCSTYNGTINVAQCLQPNTQLIINSANAGNISEARNQLIKDMNIALTWGLCLTTLPNNSATPDATKGEFWCCNKVKNVQSQNLAKVIKGLNASDITSCAYEFRAALSQKQEYIQNQNRTRNPWGP